MKKIIALLMALLMLASLPAMAEESPQEIMNRGVEAYNAGDYTLAFGCFYELAQQGVPNAQFNLGLMYDLGMGVGQSYEKAAEYYALAAAQGHSEAQFNLGNMYRNGEGLEQSYEKAFEYYSLAAEQGNPKAQFNLAVMYDQGEGVEQSAEKALEYYGMAADQGDAEAQFNLGIMYESGEGVEQSYEKAAEYYALAAEQGHAKAQFNLGLLYERGNGVELSAEKAAEYYRMAAELGLDRAQAKVSALDAAAGKDPLIAEAVAAGAHLPEPAEGEKLFLGVAEVPGTQMTKIYLAFLLAPNGQSIRSMDLFSQALEVKLDNGGDTHLINSETATPEDHWITLDPNVTSISFDSATGMGVFDLRLYGDTASCRVVVAGRCEPPKDSVSGDYRSQANLTLENLTDDAVRDAIDPPTREEALALEMNLPEPEEGEALYLGAANVSQAEALYVAFILTADGQGVRSVTTLVKDMDITYAAANRQVHITVTSKGTDTSDAQAIESDMRFGGVRLSEFALDGDAASAVLHYTYHAPEDNVDYPFDPARIAFARVE